MKKLWCLLLAFVCLLSGCSCENEEVVKTSIFSTYIKAYLTPNSDEYTLADPFGTYINLVGYKEKKVYDSEEKFNALIYKYHVLLDRNYYYKDNDENIISNIKVINDNYGNNAGVVVDPIIIEALKEGINYTKLSNGKFNIFAGSIVDVWDVRFNFFSPLYAIDPTEDEINEGMSCVLKVNDIDEHFIIDEANNKVIFKKFDGCDSGASITLGAMAKSFFLDKLVQEEKFKDIGSAIYDAGQSSIIVRGDNPTRESKEWFIAVRDSLNGGNAVQLKLVGDNAVSTSSGDNKGYIKNDGTRRHHIIDATTGYPSNYLLATTVVGESAMVMDIVTTSIMSMNLNEIKTYLGLLQSYGVSVKVLLQVKDQNNGLKLLVNDEMNELLGENYSDANIEVFNYGA